MITPRTELKKNKGPNDGAGDPPADVKCYAGHRKYKQRAEREGEGWSPLGDTSFSGEAEGSSRRKRRDKNVGFRERAAALCLFLKTKHSPVSRFSRASG